MRKIWMNALAISMLISMLLVSCNSKDKVKYKWITQSDGVSERECCFYQLTCDEFMDTITVLGSRGELYDILSIKCMDYDTFGDFVATSILEGKPIAVNREVYLSYCHDRGVVDWHKVKEIQGKYETADSLAHYLINYPARKLWRDKPVDFIAAAYICWQNNLFLYQDFDIDLELGWWSLYRSVDELMQHEPN